MSASAPRIDWASIRLTPMEDGDLDQLHVWQNDPAIRDLTMGFRGPVQRQTTAEWIASVREQNLKSRVVFALRVGAEIRGVVQLHSIDWVHRNALLGVYVGAPSDRGAGLGWAGCALILDYAFNGLNLERVWLEVLALNTGARGLYERLGFVREGVLRKAYVLDGERRDVEVHGLLRTEWAVVLPAGAARLVHGG